MFRQISAERTFTKIRESAVARILYYTKYYHYCNSYSVLYFQLFDNEKASGYSLLSFGKKEDGRTGPIFLNFSHTRWVSFYRFR